MTLTIALAQMNAAVGDIAGNRDRIIDLIDQGKSAGADLVVFPELALSGYPPEDLLLRPSFLSDCASALDEIAQASGGVTALVGYPEREGRNPYNSLAVIEGWRVADSYRKVRLPTYGVFDEDRYFKSGPGPAVITVNGITVGLTICEDVWYADQPLRDEALAGADVIVNASASPYQHGKGQVRENLLRQRARDNQVAIAYCNLVGGQDELIFDGQSMALNHRGEVIARARQFDEDLLLASFDTAAITGAQLHDTRYRRQDPEQAVPVLVNAGQREPRASGVGVGDQVRAGEGETAVEGGLKSFGDFGTYVVVDDDGREHLLDEFVALSTRPRRPAPSSNRIEAALEPMPEVYQALCLGVRDYIRKNGFQHVVLGLSGGIDSALVALIAADALGPENVTAMVMPSPHSSTETQADAREMAARLGLDLRELNIGATMAAYETELAGEFAGEGADVTEENIQARIRGNFLMALSNKFGWLVLSTGNKSEMSVGYATLYGDMAGGLAVLKDVPKTLVFELTRWRNARDGGTPPCPPAIIERPPSAELAPDQADTDSLPPYEVLDPILGRYIENDESIADIVAAGFDEAVVRKVVRLTDIAEYKRRQAPPGLKVTARAFGRDRRVPITNGYRGQLAPRALVRD